MNKYLFTCVMVAMGAVLNGGTLVMKDGGTLSNVKLISIEKGAITVEKDKVSRTVPLSKIEGYYHTDFQGPGGDIVDFSDYTLTVSDIKLKDGKGSDQECEISYRVNRVGENSKYKRVRAPYFYLYVLLAGDNEYHRRDVELFSHPKEAKIKSKSGGINDKGMLMKTLTAFDRPVLYMDNDHNNFSDRKITIPLKSVKGRKVIAYRLEVYGTASDPLEVKDWRNIDSRIGKDHKWWKNF